MISDQTIVFLGNDQASVRAQIAQSITGINVDYSVDGASQITVELVDEKLEMWNNGYFAVGNIVNFLMELLPKNIWLLLTRFLLEKASIFKLL